MNPNQVLISAKFQRNRSNGDWSIASTRTSGLPLAATLFASEVMATLILASDPLRPADTSQREFQTRNRIQMKFADFITTKAIRAELQAQTKEAVIEELVQALLDAGEIDADQREDIIASIMKREELGSTGIGRGVAVPHTKHPSVQKLVGTVGVSESGVDFDSLDGERVQLFFLLISPPERPGDHLRALENISRQLRDETFCRFLKQSQNRRRHQSVAARSRRQSICFWLMNKTPLSRTVTVRNPQGLHARPADLLVRMASKYESTILIGKDGELVDCKSILSLLTLGAGQGTEIVDHGRRCRCGRSAGINRSAVRGGVRRTRTRCRASNRPSIPESTGPIQLESSEIDVPAAINTSVCRRTWWHHRTSHITSIRTTPNRTLMDRFTNLRLQERPRRHLATARLARLSGRDGQRAVFVRFDPSHDDGRTARHPCLAGSRYRSSLSAGRRWLSNSPLRSSPPNKADDEYARLRGAVDAVSKQLETSRLETAAVAGEDTGDIFAAQLQMLHDPRLHAELGRRIRDAAPIGRLCRQPRPAQLRRRAAAVWTIRCWPIAPKTCWTSKSNCCSNSER